MNPSNEVGAQQPYDPVFLNARRELIFILSLFAVCLAWSVGVCWLDGYHVAPEGEFPTVWGMPRWVFWGIFVPWIFADVVTIGFCLFFMKDDDLGEAHEGADLLEQIDRQAHKDSDDHA